jgi:hypothetical protein
MSRDLRSMSAADLDAINERARAARDQPEPEHGPVPNHVPEAQVADQQLELFEI